MLGSLMLNRVGGHVDGADVVTIHQRSSAKRGMKQLAQPSSLSDTVGHGAILSLGTGSGDSILTLGGPRDEIVPKKHSIARGGLARVGTTSPVSIRVPVPVTGKREPLPTTMEEGVRPWGGTK